MRTFLTSVLVGAVFASRAGSQTTQPSPTVQQLGNFKEAQALCEADGGKLWGISLCGPILFVDPETRKIVANQADSRGALVPFRTANDPISSIYVGVLPKNENFANTAADWSGTHWTEMILPLPNDRSKRDTLMMHELYHRIQEQTRVPMQHNVDNAHLDTFDGRYTLLLEFRALARALQARNYRDRRVAIRDALVFRADRYRIFPGAAAEEESLEFNEGLAEYTGVRLGNLEDEDAKTATLLDLDNQAKVPTLVRSFAYGSGPAYGLLLDRYRPDWRAALPYEGSLSEMLRTSLKITLPHDLARATKERAVAYKSNALRLTETERDVERKMMTKLNHARFIDGPTLTLPLKDMSIQFDPRTPQPLDDFGTVYPQIRVSDKWGILEVSKGAMIAKDWKVVIVPAPGDTSGTNLKGDGWTLDLSKDWRLVEGARKGDFVLLWNP